jgi:HEAT repeat protein
MNRKFVNYAIFIAVVAVVVGFAVRHSRHMAYLVHSMAGPDRDLRVKAAKELVAGEQFMDAITGETVGRRIRIVQGLEDWGSKEAVKQAVAFLKDPDRPVRDRIVLALVRIGSRSADNLQEVVTGSKDGDANVRKACIAVLQVLGQDRRPRAAALLGRALPDAAANVRHEALLRRDAAVASRIVEKVVAGMKADGAARGPGGDILGALDDRREDCVKALLPQLADADDGVCSGAAAALGKVGSPTPVPQLVDAMHKRSAQVRRVVIGAIALIAAPTCEHALTEAVGNPDDDNEARAQAAVGLGRIASTSAVATLVHALRDNDLKVQTAAVDALAVGGKAALGTVLGALRDSSPGVRARAAQALAGIATPSANAALVAALRDPVSAVRQASAKALGFAGNVQAVPALAARLGDSDGRVASACADSLASIGDAARPALVAALGGGEASAFLAASALARQGEASVESVVRAAASNPRVGKWATVSLAGNRCEAALQGLRALADSSDPATREAASSALRRLSLQ